MAWLGAVVGVVGSLFSGEKSKRAGIRAQNAKRYEAQVAEQDAGQVIAASQRNALEEERRANLIASRALAVSSASGGGASDPTVVNLIADIGNEGAYRKALEIYKGEATARKVREGAKVSLEEGSAAMQAGKDKQTASYFQAAGYGASLYSKYGAKNTNKPDTGTGLDV